MDLERCLALVGKDLRVLTRSRSVLGSVVAPALVVSVLLPLLVLSHTPLATAPGTPGGWIAGFIDRMPEALRRGLAGLSDDQAFVYAVTVYYFLPFFLISVASSAVATAAEGFIQEKTWGTLDSLLYSPVTDLELLVAKILTCTVPPVLATWFSFAVYAIVINARAWPIMGGFFFPPPFWLVAMGVLVPLLGLTVTLLTLIVALRLRSSQDAAQVGNLVVIPLVALFFGQAMGYWYAGPALVARLVLAVAAADLALLLVARWTFVRHRLAERLY
ncbi:MAG: hypothetical protein RDU89_04355 [bacterium]|nr:hypothetical protein [bacterium]